MKRQRSDFGASLTLQYARQLRPHLFLPGMSRWVGIVALALLCPLWVCGESPQSAVKPAPPPARRAANDSQVVPPYQIYKDFFQQVASLEPASAQAGATGTPGDQSRLQRAIGLNAEQWILLRLVARHCTQAISEHQAESRREIMAYRSYYRSDPARAVQIPPQMRREQEEKTRRIVNENLAQLKQMLGDVSFRKLDKYVLAQAKPPAPPPKVPTVPQPKP